MQTLNPSKRRPYAKKNSDEVHKVLLRLDRCARNGYLQAAAAHACNFSTRESMNSYLRYHGGWRYETQVGLVLIDGGHKFCDIFCSRWNRRPSDEKEIRRLANKFRAFAWDECELTLLDLQEVDRILERVRTGRMDNPYGR